MKQTNWRAMQYTGANKMKPVSGTLEGPVDVLPRYMTSGSRHIDLSLNVRRKRK